MRQIGQDAEGRLWGRVNGIDLEIVLAAPVFRRLLDQFDVSGIEICRRCSDHAIGSEFAGIGVDVVINCVIDGLAGQNEGKDRAMSEGHAIAMDP